MDEPDNLAEIRTSWWKTLSFLHWLSIGIAIFVLVIYLLSSPQEGIRALFATYPEERIPEVSKDPVP